MIRRAEVTSALSIVDAPFCAIAFAVVAVSQVINPLGELAHGMARLAKICVAKAALPPGITARKKVSPDRAWLSAPHRFGNEPAVRSLYMQATGW